MTVTHFSIEYDSINSKNTFTNGDTITGRVIVEVTKDTTINSLVFIGKGEARVRWSEHYGQYQHHVYWQNEKYYEVKHYLLRATRQDGTEVIKKGRNVFPFSFQIPDRKLPSTFTSSIGKIIHKLKAELKQSMKLTKKAKIHFTFVSKPDMDIPGIMEPLYGSKDKSVRMFGSGNISMDVYIERMGFMQGEDMKVKLEINNQSSRAVKPKFILYEKRSFFAQGRRRLHTNNILKEKMKPIAPSCRETATQVISIPAELPSSNLNCSIIKLEYRLKIELDIKYATDPEVKLPIVILPAFESSERKPAPLPSSSIGFEGLKSPQNQQMSSSPWQHAAFQPKEPPPAYGAHHMYPLCPDDGSFHSAL